MTITPPTIRSERLVLRPFRAEDFEPMADFYASEVSSFYGGPCNREEAFRKFAVYPGHWALRGFGPWALEEAETGAYVGLCGAWYPEGWYAPEITWALVEDQHGKGFATEAGLRALRHLYTESGWTTAVSVIAVDNVASQRVAARMGATHERDITYRYGDAQLWRHAAPEHLLND